MILNRLNIYVYINTWEKLEILCAQKLTILLIPDPDQEEPVCFTHCQRLLRRYCKSTRQLKLKETVLPDKICLEVTQLKKPRLGHVPLVLKFLKLSLYFFIVHLKLFLLFYFNINSLDNCL